MKKVMLTAALTGAGDTVKNKSVPVTPQEIADSAIKCAKAGLLLHIHARDPETGGISHDVEFLKKQ